MKNKKILLLYDFYSEQGGVERVMKFQAQVLKKKGYKVTFGFAYVNEKLRREKLSEFDVIEYSPSLLKNEPLQIIVSMIRSSPLETFKNFDLVICHSFPASYLAYRLKKKYNIPYILNLHHPPQFLYNVKLNWVVNGPKRFTAFLGGLLLGPIFRKIDRICVGNASGHIVVCKSVGRIIKNTYGLSGKIIYPTYNPKEFNIIKNPSMPFHLKEKIKRPYLLGSGRIVRQKRFDYLIEACSLLENKREIDIVLAGNYQESEKRRLMRLSQEKDVNCKFIGPLSMKDLSTIYNLAKVTVLTCPEEWFGLVPVEASACGCPVVAWKDNFGPEETVKEGVNGYLATAYSVKDMSDKIGLALKKKWNKIKVSSSVNKFSEKNMEKEFLSFIHKYL